MEFHTRFVSWGLSALLRDGPMRRIRARSKHRRGERSGQSEQKPSPGPAKNKNGRLLTPLPSQR